MTASTAQDLQPAATELDRASLQRLRDLDPEGKNHVVERVLQAFDTSLQRLLPQGEQAFAACDRETLRHVVHTLKSSSASVGALELSRLCGDIENSLREYGIEGLGAPWAALQYEGSRVAHAVQSLLGRAKAGGA